MSGSAAAKEDWVRRVLGADIGRTAALPSRTANGAAARPARAATPARPSPAADWPKARARWQAAIEAVDGQIAALQAALRNTDDDELEAIAQFGMNGLTGDHKVKLMVAMIEVAGGDRPAMRSAGPKVCAIAQEFRKHIESDERVGACDDNPFGVAVAIRATLGPALAALVATVEAGMQ